MFDEFCTRERALRQRIEFMKLRISNLQAELNRLEAELADLEPSDSR